MLQFVHHRAVDSIYGPPVVAWRGTELPNWVGSRVIYWENTFWKRCEQKHYPQGKHSKSSLGQVIKVCLLFALLLQHPRVDHAHYTLHTQTKAHSDSFVQFLCCHSNLSTCCMLFIYLRNGSLQYNWNRTRLKPGLSFVSQVHRTDTL